MKRRTNPIPNIEYVSVYDRNEGQKFIDIVEGMQRHTNHVLDWQNVEAQYTGDSGCWYKDPFWAYKD